MAHITALTVDDFRKHNWMQLAWKQSCLCQTPLCCLSGLSWHNNMASRYRNFY